FVRVRYLRVAGEFRLQDVDAKGTEGFRGPNDRVGLVVGKRLLGLVDRVRHGLAYEREVEPTALVRDRLDDVDFVVHDLPRGVRVEVDQELRGARSESLYLLDASAVEEGREPPVAFLLVSGLLPPHYQARAAW